MNELEEKNNYTNETFEDIKHIDENGAEFWYARELQKVLKYKEWRKVILNYNWQFLVTD